MSDISTQAVYRQSTFSIPKMDCASEENLVRLALDGPDVRSLSFDLPNRELKAVHSSEPNAVLERLQPLKFGATLKTTKVLPTPSGKSGYRQTIFSVPKMDCPSEENLIRTALSGLPGINSLTFDLSNRQLIAVHQNDPAPMLERLQPLNLGTKLVGSSAVTVEEDDEAASLMQGTRDASEKRTLLILLALNGAMFFIEMALGLFAQSTGLIADSLDMFADAAVYGLALYVVGRAASMKVRAAHLAGWLQLALALGALVEVLRRFLYGSEPASALMMGVGSLALAVNVTCLVLVSAKKDHGAHMKASYIFSSNDVIANVGVIAAGALVAWTGSPYPDLVIGAVIGFIVMNGARRILKLK